MRRMAGPRLLHAFADRYPEAVFAEIGANDGEQHDLLRPLILSRPWKGIVVEPVPYVFERLERNYAGHPGLILENVAVGARDGVLPFYHLAEVDDPASQGLPRWYDGIGSFSRDEVLSHAPYIPDIAERLVTTEVQCLTLNTLCRRNGIEELDLLLIDTEGHDWEIIRHIDFAALMPRLLVFEHYHLGPEDRRDCRDHLRNVGYESFEEHFDTFCLDTSQDDELTRLWRGLRPAVPGVASYEEKA
jgi:FkbM family methyltransferase